MNDTKPKPKWSFLLPIMALCLLVYPSQVASRKIVKLRQFKEEKSTGLFSISDDIQNRIAIQKDKVFDNEKGLISEIQIEDHLRELNAISKTKEETIEELIEHVSVWIPLKERRYVVQTSGAASIGG